MAHAIESISVRPQDRPYRRIPEAPARLAELWFRERHGSSIFTSLGFTIRGAHQAAQLFSIMYTKLHPFLSTEAPTFSESSRLHSALAGLYDKRLQDAERAVDAEKWERRLAEASANRQGISALMEEDWLGLRLLAQLRLSRQMNATDVASELGASLNSVAANLARLVRFGAVDVVQDEFAYTELADELLSNIEGRIKLKLAK